jgi:hypothetical protein
MILSLVLASLPCLYWPEGLDSAAALQQVGIDRLCVPPERAAAWKDAGFTVVPLTEADLASRETLAVPGIVAQARVASPTRAPWITLNGWRFVSRPDGRYAYDLPAGKAALAAAEAFAYEADAVLKIDRSDLESLGRMLSFLSQVPSREMPAVADIGIMDDGTAALGEVMNLLVRRNLLFRVVRVPAPELRVNVRVGSPEYPKQETTDPSAFALKVRRQLTDAERTLRIYGSEVVIGRLTAQDGRARLHLVNYGGRDIAGLRIRLRGTYAQGEAWVAGDGRVALQDHVVSEGASEFSLPRLGVYAVVDLPPAR